MAVRIWNLTLLYRKSEKLYYNNCTIFNTKVSTLNIRQVTYSIGTQPFLVNSLSYNYIYVIMFTLFN